jgi:leucyl-tRNA synthetase
MPNWAGSCWYHLAFAFWDKDTKDAVEKYRTSQSTTPYSDFWREYARPAIDTWLPVDWYLGGAEHAVLHLLYARFWMKVLYDLGHIGFTEPYLRLRSVGIVLAEDGRKMSKSWGNVINPDDVVKEYGSDAVRLYEMFMGPWDQAIAWDSRALVGMKRFIERVEGIFKQANKMGEKTSPVLAAQFAKLASQVERGILEQKFNTSIAGIMELTNVWRNSDLVMTHDDAQKFAHILSPFTPTLAQKVFEKAGGKGDVAHGSWPTVDAAEIDVPVTIAVQVNGKLRSTVSVSKSVSTNQDATMAIVLEDEKVKKWAVGEIKKTIFVPGRLVNLIV